MARRPTTLRSTPTSLAPCPDKPNCVSTEATQGSRRMEPIPFEGEPELALGRLARIVESMPGGEVRRREPGYLHATFTTRLMKYVDDVDLMIDPDARVIRFRSASRIGTWDLGTNRRRMRQIRRRFLGEK
jgi:uncharacterized protein (DUF1499 family)